MGLGDTAKLLASLDLDNRKFNAGVDKSMGKLGQLGTKGVAVGSAIGTGIERLAEKGISALFGAVQAGEDSLHRLQDVTAQTGAVIQSTGGKAGITAQQIRDMAQAQEDLTTVDDKVIQSGENMLLTFTGIGKDVFPAATKAMVDMAVAMNGGNAEGVDLKSTAIQLGKALNDPIKGVGSLRRVGVQLTDAQQKQITGLLSLTKEEQKHYNALRKTSKGQAEAYKQTQIGSRLGQAQKIILGELTTEFGKAGEAAGTSGAAGVRRLSDAVEDAQMALATGLAPALDDIRGEIAKGLSDPGTQADLKHLGEWLGEAAKQGLAFAKSIPWGQVADALKTAAGFAGGLVKAFTNMPPEVQATLLALAGLNKVTGGAVGSLVSELGKGLIKGVLGMNAAVVNLNAAVVNGGGGGLPSAGAAGAGEGLFTGILSVSGLTAVAISLLPVAAALLVMEMSKDPASRARTEAGFQATATARGGGGPGTSVYSGNAPRQGGVDRTKMDPAVVAALNSIDDRTGAVGDHTAQLLEATRKNLQPLPENISAKQKKNYDALRDKIESRGIATEQRLTAAKAAVDNVRSSAESNRIALVTNARTDADRIIAALHDLKLSLSLTVRTGGQSSIAYQAATFLNRASRLEAKGVF